MLVTIQAVLEPPQVGTTRVWGSHPSSVPLGEASFRDLYQYRQTLGDHGAVPGTQCLV